MSMHKKKIISCLALLIFILIFSGVKYSASSKDVKINWSELRRKIENKYRKYSEVIEDATFYVNTKAEALKLNIVSESRILKKGDKFRLDVYLVEPEMPRDLQNVVVNDGKNTWLISSYYGRIKLSPAEEVEVQYLANWWKQLPESGKIINVVNIDGRKCYQVEFNGEEDPAFNMIWIDCKDLVLVRSIYNVSEKRSLRWEYSDFRKVKDFWSFPFQSKLFFNDKLRTYSIVKSSNVNSGIKDKVFNPNAIAPRRLNMSDLLKLKRLILNND